jgi:hypothetical protein
MSFGQAPIYAMDWGTTCFAGRSSAPQSLLKMIFDNAWGRRYRTDGSNENDYQQEAEGDRG